jgi:hypothetical protein
VRACACMRAFHCVGGWVGGRVGGSMHVSVRLCVRLRLGRAGVAHKEHVDVAAEDLARAARLVRPWKGLAETSKHATYNTEECQNAACNQHRAPRFLRQYNCAGGALQRTHLRRAARGFPSSRRRAGRSTVPALAPASTPRHDAGARMHARTHARRHAPADRVCRVMLRALSILRHARHPSPPSHLSRRTSCGTRSLLRPSVTRRRSGACRTAPNHGMAFDRHSLRNRLRPNLATV